MENNLNASGFVIQPRLQFKHLRDQMLFQYYLSVASYKESNNSKIGQVIINISEINRQLGWTRKEVYVSLDRLKDTGLIARETLPNNKGIRLSINSYETYQDLKNYKNRGQQTKNEGQRNEVRGQQEVDEKPVTSSIEEGESMTKGQQIENRGQLINITAFINSINNINKTLKEYMASAQVKNKNLSTTEEIETFVDFASRTNALPQGVNQKLLVSYFDCIRLTRQTCTVSANILVNFIDKIQKYSANQINYSLWKHIEDNDDKRETYTLGILRNVKEPEARRGLIKLKNKRGGERLAESGGSHEEFQEYDFGF
ncbi:hypothetical protein [Lederbergia citrea]|uniref:DnaD domain-containing protein n=1 Tax=Lederbergia citrea TaxID=2833581 RepID=A0A942UM06_9BACI|nr:hypothetical protein [Lederbergia citrea]MBS4204034.1 hypothetical protein [Lederbergia citrea]MBS4221381.1 hypothetical protein [Lederbergia citrea]